MTPKTFELAKYLFTLLSAFLLSSCVTYQKCKEKYFEKVTVHDTVTFSKKVTLLIPKDSIFYRIVNDTARYDKTVNSGRAKLIIKHTADTTYLQAECDSVSKSENVVFKYLPLTNNIGVSPNWRIGVYILAGALLIAILLIILLYKSKK